MKVYVLAILSSLVFISAGYAQTADVAAVSETDVVSQDSTEEKIVDQNKKPAENDKVKQTKEDFLTPEEKAKQAIANNNYSLSFFTQRMDLELAQLDQAKRFSEEDRMKRESLLKSVFMLREQSRELEQQSIEKFKSILKPEQLAVFEELRREQLAYRQNYDVFAGNVQQQVERERKIIAFDTKQMEEEAKKLEEQKKFEEEMRRREAENIKHGYWVNFE